MADKSSIEWTDATWNPVRGCTRVSPGCGGPGKHGGCYAELMAARFSEPGQWGHGFATRVAGEARWTGHVALIEEQLLLPMRWKKPRKIFVNSTSDLFHEKLPDEAIDRIFAVMALCPQHTFQILTKRPERMRAWFASEPWAATRVAHAMMDLAPIGETLQNAIIFEPGNASRMRPEIWPLPNVWLGTSVEDQKRADERIRDLLATSAAVRFLSCEPLLGPLNLRPWLFEYGCPCGWGGSEPDAYCDSCGWHGSGPYEPEPCPKCTSPLNEHQACPDCGRSCCEGSNFGPNSTWLKWIIVGGESGPRARPMHPDWARSLRDQCAAAGVPFFFKQWGEWREWDNNGFGDGEEDKYGNIVCEGRDNQDVAWASAEHPALLTVDGRLFADRRQLPKNTLARLVEHVGKKRAGRLLDGKEHNGFPGILG
jgi:protein gp37